MALPTAPPLDNLKGLSLTDVAGCIWFVWQRTYQDMTAYPMPFPLMQAEINASFPPAQGGVSISPDGPARKFFKDVQNTLEGYTQFRANLSFPSFAAAHKNGLTWGAFAAQLHGNAIYVAGLKQAKAMKELP